MDMKGILLLLLLSSGTLANSFLSSSGSSIRRDFFRGRFRFSKYDGLLGQYQQPEACKTSIEAVKSDFSLDNEEASKVQFDKSNFVNSNYGKTSSMASSINLMKNCVGAGVLSLNGRVNLISPTMSKYPQVFALVFVMGLWAIHNFYIMGETVRLTGNKPTFGETWAAAMETNDGKGSERVGRPLIPVEFVTFVITCAPIISCIANTIVLTDMLTMMLRVLGLSGHIYGNRLLVVWLLTTCILFPLCTIENLGGLKNISFIGLSGHMMAVLVMLKRSFDGSYLPGGAYHASVQWAKAQSSSVTTRSIFDGTLSKWLVFASLLSYCLVTHYNAPRYYNELKKTEGQERRSYLVMIMRSYFLACSVYCFTIYSTYRLFQSKGQSFSLNSLSPQDPLGVLAFLSFGTSVLASFPLLFLNVRNWFRRQLQDLAPLLYNKFDRSLVTRNLQPASQKFQALFTTKTVAAVLLLLIGGVASQLNDIAKLGAVAGAFFGSSMMFVFPPVMYMAALQKHGEEIDGLSPAQIKQKLKWNRFLLCMGLLLGGIGTINATLNVLRK